MLSGPVRCNKGGELRFNVLFSPSSKKMDNPNINIHRVDAMSKRYSPSDAQAAPSNPSNRLHAVLSAGLNRGLEDARKGASSATSTALRGRNPRAIRLNPGKAEALRRALETGARTESRRRRNSSSTVKKVEKDVTNRVKSMLEDGVVDLTEVAGLTAAVADGMKKIQESLNEVNAIEDAVAFQLSKGPPPGVTLSLPAAAAKAKSEERTLPEEIDSVTDDETDDEYNSPPEVEQLKASTDSLQRNMYKIERAAYDLTVPQDRKVYTDLTSDEEKYGKAFKAAIYAMREKRRLDEEKNERDANASKDAVDNVGKDDLSSAYKAEQEKARKIQEGARRRRRILKATLASLTAMLASGGLIYKLMNTAQEPIPEPPQGWGEWFVENVKDAGGVIAPALLFALTGTF